MRPINFEHVKDLLAPAMKGGASHIKREIKRGDAQTFQTDNGNVFAIVRPEGEELVFVAVAGKGLALVVHEFVAFAKMNGFKFIRYHTKNPHFLAKGVSVLSVKPQLVEVRKALIGNNEYIYRITL